MPPAVRATDAVRRSIIVQTMISAGLVTIALTTAAIASASLNAGHHRDR